MTGPGQPDEMAQLEQMQRLLSQTTPFKCTGCGNHTFEQINFIRRLSPIVSPTGKAALIPLPAYACNACGKVPDELIPEFIRRDAPGGSEELTLGDVSSTRADTPEERHPPISKGGLVLEP